MATRAEFRTMFPEFAGANDGMVDAFLARAAVSTPAESWGVLADEGQLYLTAHLLATSPHGQNARLAADDATSTYGARYQDLRAEVAASWAR